MKPITSSKKKALRCNSSLKDYHLFRLLCYKGKQNTRVHARFACYLAFGFVLMFMTIVTIVTIILQKIVNCPPGYFFNGTSCQACAVDHYQDQEAQTSCITCPSGTSTSGQQASKRRQDCQGHQSLIFCLVVCRSYMCLPWFNQKTSISWINDCGSTGRKRDVNVSRILAS